MPTRRQEQIATGFNIIGLPAVFFVGNKVLAWAWEAHYIAMREIITGASLLLWGGVSAYAICFSVVVWDIAGNEISTPQCTVIWRRFNKIIRSVAVCMPAIIFLYGGYLFFTNPFSIFVV